MRARIAYINYTKHSLCSVHCIAQFMPTICVYVKANLDLIQLLDLDKLLICAGDGYYSVNVQ